MHAKICIALHTFIRLQQHPCMLEFVEFITVHSLVAPIVRSVDESLRVDSVTFSTDGSIVARVSFEVS